MENTEHDVSSVPLTNYNSWHYFFAGQGGKAGVKCLLSAPLIITFYLKISG